jgi:hypothetical protein
MAQKKISRPLGYLKLLLPFLGASLAVFAVFGLAIADIAPTEYPPGSNISPDGKTRVQMAAEQVIFDTTPLSNTEFSERHIDVRAVFTMSN